MKLISILTIVFTSLIFSCQSEQFNKTVQYTSSVWITNQATGFGKYLSIKENNLFEIGSSGEGCGIELTGVYIISNNRVKIIPKEMTDCGKGSNLISFECEIKKDDTTLFLNTSLKCEGGTIYWKIDSKVPAGLVRKLDNLEIITMGLISAVIKEDTKLSKHPFTNAETLKCFHEDTKSQNFISQGTQVEVIARTHLISSINEKINYWYYLRTEPDWYGYGCPIGWVFGEFVKIKN